MPHRLGLVAKLALISLPVLVFGGCAKDSFVSADSGPWPDGVTDTTESCSGNMQRCLANTLQTCRNGRWVDIDSCNSGEVCSQKLKRCAQCEPGERFCQSGAVYDCNTDGNAGTKVKDCPGGNCVSGHCDDPCSIAEASRSYVGCNYYPTVSVNTMLAADFTFSVAVANAHSQPAEITVSSNSNPKVATATVAPNSLATINLPWVASLQQKGESSVESVLAAGGSYHLQSSLPVTVYQFNALDYVLPHDCNDPADEPSAEDIGDNKCYSYTNDASLLLPENALSYEYMVVTRPTHGLKTGAWPFSSVSGSPGFFAVVGVKEGQTEVRVSFTGNTQAGSNGLKSYKAGDAGVFKLGQGDVLQIVSESPDDCEPTKTEGQYGYCDFSKTTDLTGTGITADKDIAVFAGHNCTFVPYDKWACDHLEEQMFPLKSWGKRYIASHTDSSGKDPCLYRVLSAEDNNQITFNPAVLAPVTLNRGRYTEFVSDQDFEVKGTGRFAVAQFMVGQSYSSTAGEGAPGDPSMALAVPVEQYRTSYRFLAPSSYQQNYVNLIMPESSTAKLDGNAIDAGSSKAIGTTGYKVAKLKIAGGSHLIESSGSVGIMVYGVGSYTSYMYPGGLDLRLLE